MLCVVYGLLLGLCSLLCDVACWLLAVARCCLLCVVCLFVFICSLLFGVVGVAFFVDRRLSCVVCCLVLLVDCVLRMVCCLLVC